MLPPLPHSMSRIVGLYAVLDSPSWCFGLVAQTFLSASSTSWLGGVRRLFMLDDAVHLLPHRFDIGIGAVDAGEADEGDIVELRSRSITISPMTRVSTSACPSL